VLRATEHNQRVSSAAQQGGGPPPPRPQLQPLFLVGHVHFGGHAVLDGGADGGALDLVGLLVDQVERLARPPQQQAADALAPPQHLAAHQVLLHRRRQPSPLLQPRRHRAEIGEQLQGAPLTENIRSKNHPNVIAVYFLDKMNNFNFYIACL